MYLLWLALVFGNMPGAFLAQSILQHQSQYQQVCRQNRQVCARPHSVMSHPKSHVLHGSEQRSRRIVPSIAKSRQDRLIVHPLVPESECGTFSDIELEQSLKEDIHQFIKQPGIRTQEKMLQMLPKAVYLTASLLGEPSQDSTDFEEDIVIGKRKTRLSWATSEDETFAVVVVGSSGSNGNRYGDVMKKILLQRNRNGSHNDESVETTHISFDDIKDSLEPNMYINVNAFAVPDQTLIREYRKERDYFAIRRFIDRMFEAEAFQRRFDDGLPSIPVYVVSLDVNLVTPAIKAHIAIARYMEEQARNSKQKERIVPVVSALLHDATRSSDHVGALLYLQPLRPEANQLDPVWKRVAGAFISILQKAGRMRSKIWTSFQAIYVGLFFLEPILRLFSILGPILDGYHGMYDMLKFLYIFSIIQTAFLFAKTMITAKPRFSFIQEETKAFEEARKQARVNQGTETPSDPRELLRCKQDPNLPVSQSVFNRLTLYLTLANSFFQPIHAIKSQVWKDVIKSLGAFH